MHYRPLDCIYCHRRHSIEESTAAGVGKVDLDVVKGQQTSDVFGMVETKAYGTRSIR